MDNINIDKTTGEVTEASVPASKYNLEYALEQIERIANDTEHLEKAFEDLKIAAEKSEPTIEQGGSNDKVAEAVADAVRCRETTNQKLIDFYSKMVEILTGKEIKVEFDQPTALQIDGETVLGVTEYTAKAAVPAKV